MAWPAVIAARPRPWWTLTLKYVVLATVVVLSDDFNGAWVQIDGDAKVLDMPEALEPLVEYYRSISGEHPDWTEYRDAMRRQGKSLIQITPRRWGPVATGGFPSRLAS